MGVSVVALMVAGCGPSLKSQCQILGNTHNKNFQKVLALRPAGSLAYDHSIEKQMASTWTESAKQLEKLDISDSKLNKIQGELVAAHRQAGEKTSQAAALIPTHNQVNDALGDQIDQVRNGAMEKMPTAFQALTLHCTGR